MRVVFVAVVLALVAACASSEPSTADQRATAAQEAATQAGLDDEVAAFLALAAVGDLATFHASYPTGDPSFVLEVWNRPPDRRIDTVEDGVLVTSRITRGADTYRCRPDDEPACTRVDAFTDAVGPFDPAATGAFASALADSAGDFVLTVENRTVAGVPARCLVAAPTSDRTPGAPDVLCVSQQGAVLTVERAGERFHALSYETAVDGSVFEIDD